MGGCSRRVQGIRARGEGAAGRGAACSSGQGCPDKHPRQACRGDLRGRGAKAAVHAGKRESGK